MVSKLELYNRALRHLKTVRLANLTEGVASRRELDAVYDGSLQYALELGGWKFATRTSSLTEPDAASTNFGLAYAYAKPTDFVRWVAICPDDLFTNEVEDWEEEAGYIYTNLNTLYIKYVSNSTSYGLDLTAWPDNYAELVALIMAERACIPITSDVKLESDVSTKRMRAETRAKRFDAIKERVKFKPTGSLVTARFGGRGTPRFANGRMRF